MSSATATRRTPSAAGRTAAPASYDRAPLIALWLAGVGLGLVVGIDLATRSPLSGPGAVLTELGRWSALVGTYGALLVVVLIDL